MILKPGSKTRTSAWFAAPLVLLCGIGPHGQSRTAERTSNQSEVTLSSDLMNRELTTLYNRQLKLADFSGKTTIINLFATWCAPCRENLRDLTKIKQKYGGLGVEVIAVVAAVNDHDLASVRRFARVQEINFPVVWENEGFGESLAKIVDGPSDLALSVLPQTFIIGNDGRILKRFEGFNPKITPGLMREVLDQARKNKRTG
jgi:thiol-disulfide isomerase/thioredoxin